MLVLTSPLGDLGANKPKDMSFFLLLIFSQPRGNFTYEKHFVSKFFVILI